MRMTVTTGKNWQKLITIKYMGNQSDLLRQIPCGQYVFNYEPDVLQVFGRVPTSDEGFLFARIDYVLSDRALAKSATA
ncbi:hypothetical protein T265_02821 [Opisthorchis viverrini]|uniref:Uncharacterized protein n=1 Tax=Opisthorchis viverrini TaxID=6198 RepID=A0A075AI02_OPIVI|nr:hypothetical protein T265_02821 [Opisthorchis viverrini]KER30779.1 hypothetical protein T265_02821 [Opisthorchis viverrini]